MRKAAPIATYIGIATTALGFVVIALAWNGAASLDYVQGQFPYLLSGGMVGLALIVIGVTVMVIEVLRREAAARDAELDRLEAGIQALLRHLSPPDEFDPSVTGEYRPRPRVASNGHAADDDITATWEQPA